MENILRILKKENRIILVLSLLMFLTIVITNYYNYKRNINETNIKNLINNIYFKKTLSNIFNQLEPKYERVDHLISKGETLSYILKKYSVNNEELELVKKSLINKYKINSLKINDILQFTIDRSSQKIVELSYPVSKTKKIYLLRNEDQNIFNEKVVTTQLTKKIIYDENIIMNSLYKSASDV